MQEIPTNPKRTGLYIGVPLGLAILAYFPRFFEISLEEDTNGAVLLLVFIEKLILINFNARQGVRLAPNDHTMHWIYQSIYSIWFLILAMYVIPMAILIFCNYKVYKHVQKQEQQEQEAVILFCISITLFLCNLPRGILLIYDGFHYHLNNFCPSVNFWIMVWNYIR